ISQDARRHTGEASAPGVVVRVTWAGELKRVTQPPSVDPASYAADYHSAVDVAVREEVLVRASRYASGLAEPGKVVDFVKLLTEVAQRADSTLTELRAVAECLPELSTTEAMKLADTLLARQTEADPEVLAALGLRSSPEVRTLGAKVFHER